MYNRSLCSMNQHNTADSISNRAVLPLMSFTGSFTSFDCFRTTAHSKCLCSMTTYLLRVFSAPHTCPRNEVVLLEVYKSKLGISVPFDIRRPIGLWQIFVWIISRNFWCIQLLFRLSLNLEVAFIVAFYTSCSNTDLKKYHPVRQWNSLHCHKPYKSPTRKFMERTSAVIYLRYISFLQLNTYPLQQAQKS